MQARKLLRAGLLGAGLAAAALLLCSSARAESGAGRDVIVRRAELDGPDLKLCIQRGHEYETLVVDSEDPDTTPRVRPGCGGFGDGERIEVLDSEDTLDAVHVDGETAVYIDREGRELRIPLEPEPLEADADDEVDPRGMPDEPLECDPYDDDPRYGASCDPHERERYDRGCEGRGCRHDSPPPPHRRSHRVVLPGPRAGEIGEAATNATLSGLEQTLDPITEPALALTLRGATAAIGIAVGAALYVPTTILDVLDTEYGTDSHGAPECDPYERDDDRDWSCR